MRWQKDNKNYDIVFQNIMQKDNNTESDINLCNKKIARINKLLRIQN